MGAHIVNGQFQSDKYPTTPPGKVPLSVKDKTAQDLLWIYAQRRREVDAEFADDLEQALVDAGLDTAPMHKLREEIEAKAASDAAEAAVKAADANAKPKSMRLKVLVTIVIGFISVLAMTSGIANSGINYRQMKAIEKIAETCGGAR